MKRRLSIKRLLVLLGASVGVGVGAYSLHAYQVKRQAGGLISRAAQAEAEGKYSSALDYLRRYIGFRPKDDDGLARYARLLARDDVAITPRARFHAATVLENVLRRDSNREPERRLVIDLYFNLGLYKDAEQHVRYLLNADPNNGPLLGKLARCQEGRGQYREARGSYERALRKPSAEVENYAGLAHLLRGHAEEVLRPGKDRNSRETAAGLAKQAEALLDQFIQANPGRFQGYVERAKYRRRYPPVADAKAAQKAVEDDLKQALRLAPDNVEVLLALAELASDQRDAALGRQLLDQALVKHPEDWRPHLALARLDRSEGRPDAALSGLREALRQVPGCLELLWERADLLVEQGDKDAADAIGQLKANGVPQPELDFLTARLLVRERKWAEGLNLLVGAYSGIQGRPRLAQAPFTLGLLDRCASLQAQCYQQLGDYHRAQAVYQRMLSLAPRSFEARLGVATTHAALGRRREAEDQYRQLLALPGSPQGAWVEVARLVLQRNLGQEAPDWDEVEEALRQAEGSRQRGVEVAMLWADALLARDRVKQARELLTLKLLQVTPLPLGLLRPELLAAATAPGRDGAQAPLIVGLAVLEERANRPAAASQLLEEARRRYGDLPELRQAQAAHWSRRGGPEAAKALQGLEGGLEAFPAEQRRRLRMSLGVAHLRLGQPDEARRLWREVAAEHPDDWASRLTLIDFALDKDDADSAKELARLIDELRNIEKEDGVLWRGAAVRHLLAKAARGDRSQLAAARRLTAEIVQRWPAWVGALLLEAQIEDLAGATDKALKKYQDAINRGGATAQAVRRAWQLLYERQRFQEAHALQAKLPRDAELAPGMERMAAVVSLQVNDRAAAVARAERTAKDSSNYTDHLFLGQMYWADGRLDKAEASLTEARDRNDKAPETWVTLVSFLAKTGKKEQALAEVARAEKRLSGMRGVLGLARCYELVGEDEKAAKIYTSPEVVRSPDLTARRAVAGHLLRSGKAKEAGDHLRYLVKAADPKDPETAGWARAMLAVLAALGGNYAETKDALAGLGGGAERHTAVGVSGRRTQAVLLASRGNRQDRVEAIRLLEELIDDGVDQPQDRLLLALQYEANNEWPKARKQLVSLRKMPRGDTLPVLVAYASAMLRHEELNEAEQAVGQLDKLEPDNLAVVSLRAQVWHRRGRKREAVALLTDFATRQGKSFGHVAEVLERLQEPQAAGEMYRRHAEKAANPAAALAHAGFLGRQNRPNEALDICEQAWANAPPELVADSCLAILESTSDEDVRTRVERQLEAALKKHPRSAAVRLGLANLRMVQGRYPEAERLYRELVAESRDNLLARNNLAWLLACQGDRADEALRLVQEAIRAGGPQAMLLDTQALAYLAAGKPKEAIRLLEALVLEAPREPMYLLHLAKAYATDGNRQAALRSLQQARREGFKAEALHPLERPAYTRLMGELGQRVSATRP